MIVFRILAVVARYDRSVLEKNEHVRRFLRDPNFGRDCVLAFTRYS